MNLLDHYSRLHDFMQRHYRDDIYPEPASELHQQITGMAIEKLSRLTPLPGKKILDCGCGQGVALGVFASRGADATGLTFGEDFQQCLSLGFKAMEMDQSFLDFDPGTFDIVWCRHALEHSFFPFFTLSGFFSVLKPGGLLYVEVPAPGTAAKHETNRNHYSCFTASAWSSLFERSGFTLIERLDYSIPLAAGTDIYHAFYLQKPARENAVKA